MKLRLLTFILLFSVILCGCEEYKYTIDMKYDGDAVIRKIVCSENVPKEVRDRLSKLYSKQIDANSFEGSFGEELPGDVGGFGRNVRVSNPMGDAYIYVERFQGKDAPAIDVEKSLGAADRLTDMIIDWLEFELGSEPGFGELKAFCDVELREDIKNLALYFWMGEKFNQSEVNDSEFRILLYLYERQYFTVGDLSAIAISTDESGWILPFVRNLIRDKLGSSKSKEEGKGIAFLESEESFHRSASRFLASLEKDKKSDQKSGGKSGESSGSVESLDDITEEIFSIYSFAFEEMLGFELFGDAPAKVNVMLHCGREPFETNGQWDEKAGQVRWSGKVEEDNVPFICYSMIGEPDERFQMSRFGRVVLADNSLVEYVFWYKGLDEKQKVQWDGFLGSLNPGQELESKIKSFRFKGEPAAEAESEEGDRLLSDTPRKSILEGLKKNSDGQKEQTAKEDVQVQREVFSVYPIGKVVKKDGRTFIEIDKQYTAGLKGLEVHDYVNVVYWFDKNDTLMKRSILQVHPRGDGNNPLTGVFATHSPVRPNLIAISKCDIISVKENVIEIKEIDAFDGSPVIDLKGDFFRFYKPDTK